MTRPEPEREESIIPEITEKFKEERKINHIALAYRLNMFIYMFLKSQR